MPLIFQPCMILDATKIVPTKIYNLKLSLPKKVKLSNLWLDYFRFTEIEGWTILDASKIVSLKHSLLN